MHHVCSGKFSLFVNKSTSRVANGTIASIFYFLKEYTPDLIVVSIGTECLLSFLLVRSTPVVLLSGLLMTTLRLFFSFRRLKCLFWSFHNVLLRVALRCAKFRKPNKDFPQPLKGEQFCLRRGVFLIFPRVCRAVHQFRVAGLDIMAHVGRCLGEELAFMQPECDSCFVK